MIAHQRGPGQEVRRGRANEFEKLGFKLNFRRSRRTRCTRSSAACRRRRSRSARTSASSRTSSIRSPSRADVQRQGDPARRTTPTGRSWTTRPSTRRSTTPHLPPGDGRNKAFAKIDKTSRRSAPARAVAVGQDPAGRVQGRPGRRGQLLDGVEPVLHVAEVVRRRSRPRRRSSGAAEPRAISLLDTHPSMADLHRPTTAVDVVLLLVISFLTSSSSQAAFGRSRAPARGPQRDARAARVDQAHASGSTSRSSSSTGSTWPSSSRSTSRLQARLRLQLPEQRRRSRRRSSTACPPPPGSRSAAWSYGCWSGSRSGSSRDPPRQVVGNGAMGAALVAISAPGLLARARLALPVQQRHRQDPDLRRRPPEHGSLFNDPFTWPRPCSCRGSCSRPRSPRSTRASCAATSSR